MSGASVSDYFERNLDTIRQYFLEPVLFRPALLQLFVITVASWVALAGTRALRDWCNSLKAACPQGSSAGDDLDTIIDFLSVIKPFFTALVIWIAKELAEHFHWPGELLHIALLFFAALTLVRLFTRQMKNRFLSGILQFFIWLWTLLFALHLIDPWLAILDDIDFSVGQSRFSLLIVHNALLLTLLLYWVIRKLIIIWHLWLSMGSDLEPALQILLYKLGSILLYAGGAAAILHYMGLDLTVITLFSGALGLGLGFGLQKIFANLVSGLMILADKSIKPGDVIQMGEQYGWINFLGSRYVSVVARNGTEHLIPNEQLIANEVVNWSYSNKLVRLSIPIGVAYDADLEKARELMLEVANATARVLVDPKPSCLLSGFGESAVNLELRVWINDPQNGLGRVKSDLNWGIWKVFKENGIEIPFPQREVHLKTGYRGKGKKI